MMKRARRIIGLPTQPEGEQSMSEYNSLLTLYSGMAFMPPEEQQDD